MPATASSNADATAGPSKLHPIEYLDPNSYTANRLQHATPKHLYLTSRRCFVGPIPEGWLKSHRRDWYKRYLGLNYSSRSVSFEAGEHVGHHRAVTGLDGPSLSIAHQQSFRQPEDLDGPTDDNQDDESSHRNGNVSHQHDDRNTVSAQSTDLAVTSVLSPVSFDAKGNEIRSPEPEPDLDPVHEEEGSIPAGISHKQHSDLFRPHFKKKGSASVKPSAAASQRPKNSRQASSIGSFVTASETPSASPSGSPLQRQQRPRERGSGYFGGVEPVADSRPSDATTQSTSGSWNPANKDPPSTEHLLEEPETSNEGSASTQKPDIKNDPSHSNQDFESQLRKWREQNSSPTASNQLLQDGAVPVSAKKDANRRARTKSVGLVRFDMPPEEGEDDEQNHPGMRMKLRLEQTRRRDTIARVGKRKLQGGTVVKMEKMLVRIEWTSHELVKDYDENDSIKIEARTLEKWHEFMVVCREGERDDSKFCLQLYKTRVIPTLEDPRVSTRSAHEILLKRKTTHINLYSSLDKTIVLWHPHRKGTKIFILKTRAGANAMEWLTFLRNVLGWHQSHVLQVNVPDLGVTLRLRDPFADLLTSQNAIDAAQGDEDALRRAMREEEAMAGTIVQRCIATLEKSPEWHDVVAHWTTPVLHQLDSAFYRIKSGEDGKKVAISRDDTSLEKADSIQQDKGKGTYAARSLVHDPVGLAWKRYDRLEWVHGANEKKMYGTIAMARSHELELRPKQHYSTTVTTDGGQELEEPPPIEGFLIRLTSQKGNDQKLGKLFFKRLYFSTHNQFMVFCRPAHAQPPPPPSLFMDPSTKVPNSHEIAQKIPLIYSVNPYPFKDGWIGWLTAEQDETAEGVSRHDRDAFVENDRTTNLLLNCDGTINLCDVVTIRDTYKGATQADDNFQDGEEVDFDQSVPDSFKDDGVTREAELKRAFEMVMRNGLVVRLQAFNETAKAEWVKRLKALKTYWTARIAADMALYRSVRKQNLELLNIDEELEAVLGQFAHKWEFGRSYASPELHHMCGISCCRTIHMSGMLYYKSRMHANVKQSAVILTHGRLIFFRDAIRARSGRSLPHTYHPRVASLELRDCYIYSGLVTDHDLLYTNRHFDKNRPGHHALPRMYAKDNWTSIDEDVMTCFVVWHGKQKSWFRSEEASETAQKKQTLKHVSKLGVEGKRIVFKARSRAERDHWVMSIAMEIERTASNDDVRLVDAHKSQ